MSTRQQRRTMRGDPSGRKVSVQDGEGDTKKEKKEKKVKVAAVMWCLSCEKTSGTSAREREREVETN